MPRWFSHFSNIEWGKYIEFVTYGCGLFSWFICLLWVRDFSLDECIDNFGAIFLHYFGYIEESSRNDAVFREGTKTMKRLFDTNPDWAWYDGPDTTTTNVRDYWVEPTLGGGSLREPIKTITDPGIQTPINDMLDNPNARTFGFHAGEKIQMTRHSPYYFVDFLLLSGNQ